VRNRGVILQLGEQMLVLEHAVDHSIVEGRIEAHSVVFGVVGPRLLGETRVGREVLL